MIKDKILIFYSTQKTSILLDTVRIIAVTAVYSVLFKIINLFQRYTEFAESFKTIELRELPLTLIVLGFSLVWFIYRRFIEIGAEINKRMKIEETLRENEQKYRQLANSIADIFFAFNKNLRCTYWNKASENLTGVSAEEAIGRSIFEIFPDSEETKRAVEIYQNVLEAREPQAFANEYHFKGKKYILEISAYPSEEGLSVVAKDITELRQAEEEKGHLQAQLLQSQKMEAIGTLTGGIAHDFNNLLTVIKGHAQLGLMKVDASEPLYSNMKEIGDAADRAANLTRQLLLYSRRQPMDYTYINMNNTVRGMLKMLHRLIGEDIEVHTDYEEKVWTVEADEGNIEQIIMNLSVNSRDAMPEGGTLTFKTENVTVDESYTAIYTYAFTGDFVCLSIEDNGSGMDKETVEHIFEPFFTTKEVGKGTGLGLSVVYGIIREHKGWVNVYSEPGKGTIFKVYIPATFEEREYVSEEKTAIIDLRGKGETILLVEDEESVLQTTRRILEEHGYVVIKALNADEAMNAFEENKDTIDLLFTDTILPGKTGIQLIDDLRALKSDLRVLLSSGYTGERVNREAMHLKKLRFVQKPYDMNELLTIIKECMYKQKG